MLGIEIKFYNTIFFVVKNKCHMRKGVNFNYTQIKKLISKYLNILMTIYILMVYKNRCLINYYNFLYIKCSIGIIIHTNSINIVKWKPPKIYLHDIYRKKYAFFEWKKPNNVTLHPKKKKKNTRCLMGTSVTTLIPSEPLLYLSTSWWVPLSTMHWAQLHS